MNTNMKELNLNEMEQVNGGSLLSWLTEKFIEPLIKIYHEYEKLRGN